MHIREALRNAVLLPELRLDDPRHALPLARALFAAGIRALEIDVRSPAGLAAIEAARTAFPQAISSASGLSRAVHFAAAGRLSASFDSSPGFTTEMGAAGNTPADHRQRRQWRRATGLRDMKFFPVQGASGAKIIRLLGHESPEDRFVVACLGGAGDRADYLPLAPVLCVGAPRLVPDSLLESGRWDDIEAGARAALAEGQKRSREET